MSGLITAARPYARAAFATAREHDTIVPWSQALVALATVVSDPAAGRLTSDPRYSTRQISSFITDVLGKLLDSHMKNFIHLLSVNRRLVLASEIATLFERYHARDRHVSTIEIISAQPLEPTQQAALCRAVESRTGQKTSTTCRVSPELLGGAVVRIGDLVIDGSLKTRLEKLSQTLVH